jgi:hypothetical protein
MGVLDCCMEFKSHNPSVHDEILRELSHAFFQLTGQPPPQDVTSMSNRELRELFRTLGAHPQLLSIIAAMGDNLSDAEILQYLKEYTQQVALGYTGEMRSIHAKMHPDLSTIPEMVSDEDIEQLAEEGLSILQKEDSEDSGSDERQN